MGMAVRGGGTTGSVGVGIPGSLPEALGRCQEKCVIKYSDIAAASGFGINHLRRWRATASVQLHGPLARAGRAFSPYRLIARLAQGLSRVECDGAMSGGLDSCACVAPPRRVSHTAGAGRLALADSEAALDRKPAAGASGRRR